MNHFDIARTTRISRRFAAAALIAAVAGSPLSALAQKYPERPIRAVQGFAVGGNADTIARLVGTEMAKSLNQPVVAEWNLARFAEVNAGWLEDYALFVALHDDLFDFFYEALPGYEEVGRRRRLQQRPAAHLQVGPGRDRVDRHRRRAARAALGPLYDLRRFDDAVVLGGNLPLTLLERVIDEYIALAATA